MYIQINNSKIMIFWTANKAEKTAIFGESVKYCGQNNAMIVLLKAAEWLQKMSFRGIMYKVYD